MSGSVATGLIALAGVIVGGTLNGVVNYWLQRRLERRSGRTAGRFVREELDQTVDVLDGVLDQGSWHPMRWLRLEEWKHHRGILADQMASNSWNRLARVYGDLTRLSQLAERDLRSSDPEDVELRPEELEDVTQVRMSAMEVLLDILIPVSNHGPQRRWLARWYWRQRLRVRRLRVRARLTDEPPDPDALSDPAR